MLNVPTEPTGPNAPTLPSISDQTVLAMFMATKLYVNQYDATGDCTVNPPTDCKFGAKDLAVSISSSVTAETAPPLAMPPAPAPRVDGWAVDILKNWSSNPVCSNSPNPDPAICPNGP